MDETPKWVADLRPPASRVEREAAGTYGEQLPSPEQRRFKGAAFAPVKTPPLARGRSEAPIPYHQRVRAEDLERLGFANPRKED